MDVVHKPLYLVDKLGAYTVATSYNKFKLY